MATQQRGGPVEQRQLLRELEAYLQEHKRSLGASLLFAPEDIVDLGACVLIPVAETRDGIAVAIAIDCAGDRWTHHLVAANDVFGGLDLGKKSWVETELFTPWGAERHGEQAASFEQLIGEVERSLPTIRRRIRRRTAQAQPNVFLIEGWLEATEWQRAELFVVGGMARLFSENELPEGVFCELLSNFPPVNEEDAQLAGLIRVAVEERVVDWVCAANTWRAMAEEGPVLTDLLTATGASIFDLEVPDPDDAARQLLGLSMEILHVDFVPPSDWGQLPQLRWAWEEDLPEMSREVEQKLEEMYAAWRQEQGLRGRESEQLRTGFFCGAEDGCSQGFHLGPPADPVEMARRCLVSAAEGQDPELFMKGYVLGMEACRQLLAGSQQ